MDKETKGEIDALKLIIIELKKENENRDTMQANYNKLVLEDLTEIKEILKGDGTNDNPGILKTFKWLQTLKVYAQASWFILVFLIGLAWGAVKFILYIKEHLFK